MSEDYPIIVHPDCDCFDHFDDPEYVCICGAGEFCPCAIWRMFYFPTEQA